MHSSISGILRTVVILCVCLVALAEEKIPQDLKWRLERAKKYMESSPQDDPEYVPSEACLKDWDTRDFANSRFADWAARMIDAGGRLKSGTYAGATHMLGDYDLCVKVKATGWNYTTILGQYYEHNFNAKYFRSFYVTLTAIWSIGTCAPDTCNTTDITYLKRHEDELPIIETYTPDTSTIGDKPESIAAVFVLSFFGALVLVASLLDYKWARDSRKSVPTICIGDQTATANGQTNAAFATDMVNGVSQDSIELEATQTFKGTTTLNGDSAVTEGGRGFDLAPEELAPEKQKPGRLKLALLAFSLLRNFPKVTSAKVVPGAYGCIHGIRLLTMAWIIMGHSYQMGFYVIGLPWTTVAENYYSQFELMGRWTHSAINEMSVCVDSFFVMGGCLVAISFMKALSRQNNRPTVRQMLLYYFHRYWRLTPVYMIILMIWACLWRLWVTGPNLPAYFPEVDECKNEWWVNVVYLNNILAYSCMGWSWYLANDFQFYVFSPVVMIPMYMWPIAGIIFLVLCICGSLASSIYILTFVYDNERDHYLDYYVKPWCRYTSYAIGTLLGYIMYKTKCKPVVVAYWAMTLFMLLFPVWGSTSSWFPKEAYVAYESTRRHCFGLGVAMLIFACTSGYGGMINTFLSWKFFIPFSRLTYIGYLIHPMVLYFFEYNSHQMIYVNDTNVVFTAGGVMFYTTAVSFLLTLVFEVPMLALEKVFIPQAKKSA